MPTRIRRRNSTKNNSTQSFTSEIRCIILATIHTLLEILASLIRVICYIYYTLHALLHPIFFLVINLNFHKLLNVPFWPNHFPAVWLRLVQLSFLIGLIHCLLLLYRRIASISAIQTCSLRQNTWYNLL